MRLSDASESHAPLHAPRHRRITAEGSPVLVPASTRGSHAGQVQGLQGLRPVRAMAALAGDPCGQRPSEPRAQATLLLKRLRGRKTAAINGAVNTSRASLYFWYYFPKPQAEEGVRAL